MFVQMFKCLCESLNVCKKVLMFVLNASVYKTFLTYICMLAEGRTFQRISAGYPMLFNSKDSLYPICIDQESKENCS